MKNYLIIIIFISSIGVLYFGHHLETKRLREEIERLKREEQEREEQRRKEEQEREEQRRKDVKRRNLEKMKEDKKNN